VLERRGRVVQRFTLVWAGSGSPLHACLQFGKYCISLLTGETARVEDLLYDEYTMMGLMQFMDDQGRCVE
jgi:hypothetical protein